jgi:hypothetical protein
LLSEFDPALIFDKVLLFKIAVLFRVNQFIGNHALLQKLGAGFNSHHDLCSSRLWRDSISHVLIEGGDK